MKELLVVGGGKMGEALVTGLLDAGWARPEQLAVVEVSGPRRAELTGEGGREAGEEARREARKEAGREAALARRYPGLQVVAQVADAGPAKGAVLAVKPADIGTAGRSLGDSGVTRVLSIAAGVTLAELEPFCPPGSAVVRAMPNIAALVKASATALAPGSHAGPADVEWAAGVMQSVGLVVQVPEKLLDAVTGLSGSGPAYFFLVVEAMTEAGVLEGLPRQAARELVAQTLVGAGQLLAATGQSAEELRAAVTSPGGTTAAGLRQLEAGGARSAIIEAVVAATSRSRELGTPRAARS